MQPHLAAPPAGLGSVDAVAAALDKSSLVEAKKFGAEGEEGAGWYVRRTSELKRPEDAMDRSVYAKGFPTFELAEAPTAEQRTEVKQKEDQLQIELEAWARGLNVGDVKAVRMRRDTKGPVINGKPTLVKGRGKFKGSVFVEFAQVDSVPAFLALDPKPTFNGAELEVMSKAAYVEMKRLIYAPDSAPIAGAAAVPRNPHSKNARPFNAWAEKLVGPRGFPRKVDLPEPRTNSNGKDANLKKRKADGEAGEEQSREILFDGVRFTARKTAAGEVEIVDEANVGTEAGKWTNKVLKFTINSKAPDGAREEGAPVNFGDLKKMCFPIVKPGFFSLLDHKPAAEVQAEPEAPKSEFPVKLTAPPTIGSAADAPAPATVAPTSDSRSQAYPARGQAAFRDEVTDEILAKIKSDIGSFEGRTIEWVRVSRKCLSSSASAHLSGEPLLTCLRVVSGCSRGGARLHARPRAVPRQPGVRAGVVVRWTWGTWRAWRRTRWRTWRARGAWRAWGQRRAQGEAPSPRLSVRLGMSGRLGGKTNSLASLSILHHVNRLGHACSRLADRRASRERVHDLVVWEKPELATIPDGGGRRRPPSSRLSTRCERRVSGSDSLPQPSSPSDHKRKDGARTRIQLLLLSFAREVIASDQPRLYAPHCATSPLISASNPGRRRCHS